MTIKSALPLLWIAGLGAASLATPKTTSDLESLAKDLTQQSAARQFDLIVTHFDEAMTSAMPAAKLVEFWDGLVGQMGAFQSIAGTRVQTVQGYQVVLVTSKFEKATLNVKWVFDSKSRVAGFFVVPVESDAPWTPPNYAKPSSFHEQQITVGSAPWQLPGTLTLPNGTGPFPAVVLVHGSGPHDQDEAIGPNKPFKDLAWGLASRNIAVVRYNKRTLQYGKEIKVQGAGLTVHEETVEDARLAVALLAKRPEIDSRRIFVLGHSLGGMLAPRIAQGEAQVAGLVMLAGTTRPLEQVIVEQLKYIAGLDGKIAPAAQKQIEAAEQSAKEIESPTLAADAKLNVLGTTIYGSYFLDLRSYHPAEVAAQLKIPMLILRGERDYQVTSEDFDGWKKALAGKPEVTLKVYPGLFHLFMPSSSPGTGLGTPADYQKPGHVVEPVIEDIASWILVQRGGSK
ncbi:MAG: alpha/beta fold hydrolase [Bryobacteraceae bacterium]|jgi:dienelactone hydrolase